MNNFEVTDDNSIIDNLYNITPNIRNFIIKFNNEVYTKISPSTIKTLKNLIAAYPHIPQFQNLLCVLYNLLGKQKEAFEENNRLLQVFPNYLYAKINKANQLLTEGNAEKALDEIKITIDALYPERNIFHTSEVESHSSVAISCLIKLGRFKEAVEMLKQYRHIATDDEYLEKKHEIILANPQLFNDLMTDRTTDSEMDDIGVELPPQTIIKPAFNQDIINALYEYCYDIPHDVLEQILSLPRKSVIADLKTVLYDTALRNDYFQNDGYVIENHTFPLHAFLLLGELEAEESLEEMFEFLSYKYEHFIIFWLGDFMDDLLWQPLLRVGKNQTEKFKAQLLRNDISEYVRNTYALTLKEIALHQPEKRQEIIDIYKEVFEHFLKEEYLDESNTVFLSLLIGNCIEGQFDELMPEIIAAHDAEFVDEFINGTLEKVEEYMQDGTDYKKLEIQTLQEIYKELYEFEESIENTKGPHLKKLSFINQSYIKAEPKIGRNDPCSCGSGKKYKKCCGD